jgi:phosphomannomutase/phosphoglucomutase
MRLHQDLRLFGSSGIRGLTNIEITPAFTLKLAEAYGILLGPGKTVVVGRDTRYGSETIQTAAMTGLASVGADVEDCGCLPAGALLHYLVRSGADGGLMISGSHLPPDMIGIIPLLEDGRYAGPDTALRIEHLFFSSAANRERLSADRIGRIDRSSVIAPYLNDLLNMVNDEVITERGLRVMVDPENGTSSVVLSSLLRKLGCEVIAINDAPKGIPAEQADPADVVLKKASAAVMKNRCDFGVVLDSDADRTVFIDSHGNIISGDYVAAVFANEYVKKGDTVVAPVNASTLISHVCTRLKANIIQCPVGQPFITAMMKEHGASFSYDKHGKFFFSGVGPWSDGLITTLKLIELFSRPKQTLDRTLSVFPDFYQKSASVECAPRYKRLVMSKVGPVWNSMDRGRQLKKIEIDGIKHVYDDYSWLLIRPSGTEPAIRIYSDSMNQSRAKELVQLGEKIVRRAIKAP